MKTIIRIVASLILFALAFITFKYYWNPWIIVLLFAAFSVGVIWGWCEWSKKIITALLIVSIATIPLHAEEIPPSPPPSENLVQVLCVLAIGGIILTIGGCAAYKLCKQPPRNFGDDEEDPAPPTPPPCTNSTPPIIIGPIIFAASTSGPNCDGMALWDLTTEPVWQQSPAQFNDSVLGQPFTHLITTSIETSTNLIDWQVAGSRMVWLTGMNPQSALVVYLDGSGAKVGQQYLNRQAITAGSLNNHTNGSSVRLLASEAGQHQQCFFRLVAPTNHIGVLTND